MDTKVNFVGLRHGGNVEADLTDAQRRPVNGHLTTAALLRDAQPTPKQSHARAKTPRRSDEEEWGVGMSR
ncbi:hypothetical protein [Methylobacterium trifolii]|uniref:Uncharacterized protein n=1 Tax=Methylobacterium trifolii TaxID=1003092 RepID=A0ABQ4TWI8_9HYPH|nr:hypothetical protein [Methylobacterium trifolii]GJE58372.1 hypothetical protein MPOCJGCO_0451 [Methylobacterium trifolii]